MSIVDHSKLILCPLSSEIDLINFDCANTDLNEFLRERALTYQIEQIAQTTCVFYDSKLVAYFTLACDSLVLEKREKRRIFDHTKQYIVGYPALKLARLALCKEHKRQKLGSLLVKFIKGYGIELNKRAIACRFITVDANPESHVLDFYKKNGFIENFIPEERRKGESTISMRFDLLPTIPL